MTTIGNSHSAAGKSLEIYSGVGSYVNGGWWWWTGAPSAERLDSKLFPAAWLKPTRKIHAILYITGFNRKAFSSWTRVRECTSMRFFHERRDEGLCRVQAMRVGRKEVCAAGFSVAKAKVVFYALERSRTNVDSMRSRVLARHSTCLPFTRES